MSRCFDELRNDDNAADDDDADDDYKDDGDNDDDNGNEVGVTSLPGMFTTLGRWFAWPIYTAEGAMLDSLNGTKLL